MKITVLQWDKFQHNNTQNFKGMLTKEGNCPKCDKYYNKLKIHSKGCFSKLLTFRKFVTRLANYWQFANLCFGLTNYYLFSTLWSGHSKFLPIGKFWEDSFFYTDKGENTLTWIWANIFKRRRWRGGIWFYTFLRGFLASTVPLVHVAGFGIRSSVSERIARFLQK